MRNVKILAYFSQAWGTANRVLLGGGKMTLAPAADDERGDTLVPVQTVVAMSSSIELDRFQLFGEGGNTMKHFALSIDPFVATGVRAFLAT